ncbi:toxic anion resistance protein [Ureibacillus aquaedulcis]|uniref:Toxic anion resistance protein n=1 Tax=Ureibacillus aquaedulcis TaxID=3058421 RepID=A0ABT8GMI1_9BACL|nr:toxic anion resistance protein [Ureibacillus sp. BA0131]MDN4492637.1 toxic anion resistance protein [Ureibacillus sp. BA0131]
MQLENEPVQLPNELERKTAEIKDKVQNSPEIHVIGRQLDIENLNSLVSFGSQSAVEISRFSDMILSSIRRTKMEEAKDLTLRLGKIMDLFNLDDFDKEKKPTLFQKLFNKTRDSMEAIHQKYELMQTDVEKVGITLKKFETDILKENDQLETMFHHNLAYYEELQKYIIVGQKAVGEISGKLLPECEERVRVSGNQLDLLKLQNLNEAKQMLEQRVYDLQLAENVALQSLPMIKMTQMGNDELVRKINASFIVTLPLFKQALVQSVALKRQEVRAKSQQALDARTNEILRRNSDNSALQEKAMERLKTGKLPQMETLEKTWNTIMQGIEDVKKIYANSNEKRKAGTNKLEQFKRNLEQRQLLRN